MKILLLVVLTVTCYQTCMATNKGGLRCPESKQILYRDCNSARKCYGGSGECGSKLCCRTRSGRRCIPGIPPPQPLCPDGSKPVNCIQDPCLAQPCRGVQGAVCKANFCGGCNAEWFLNGQRLTDMQCERPLCKRLCPDIPCNNYECQVNEKPSHCVADTCNNCAPLFYNDRGERLRNCVSTCPGGRPPVHCTKDPCMMSSCASRPGATCKANYCGGCNAEWYYNGQLLTQMQCEEPLCERLCPTISCRNYNCKGYGTPKYCVPDTCSGCDPLFYNIRGERIGGCEEICPDGSTPVNCVADPCSVSSCPNVPDATCKSDFCGGCNAIWTYNNEVLTQSECEGNICPDGSKPVNCFVDPCSVSSCGVPGATCVSNYCGGCNADWYLGSQLLTDKQCDEPKCRRYCPASSCNGYLCKGHEDSFQCVPNTCKNCEPMFYSAEGDRIKCTKLCADGSEPANCNFNPCTNAKCTRYPHAKCEVNQCGAGRCIAEFWVGDNRVNCDYDVCPYNDLKAILCPAIVRITCQQTGCRGNDVCCGKQCDYECRKPLPPQPYCPPDAPKVKCRHPCETSTCPGAVCRADFCGKCVAEWYDDKTNKKLTEQECKKRGLAPQCPSNTPIQPFCAPFLENECHAAKSCRNGEYCCNNGCINVCRGEDSQCPSVYFQSASSGLMKCQKPCSSGCSKDEICCNRKPCGLVCVPKPISQPAPLCPGPLPMVRCHQGMVNQCDANNQCGHNQFCCNNGCINVCQGPDVSCPENAHMGLGIDAFAALCQRPCSSGCGRDEMCCKSQCGLVCTTKCLYPPCAGDPCLRSSCGVRGAVCKPNYCNTCAAEWFLNGVKLTDEQCAAATAQCPTSLDYRSLNCANLTPCNPYGHGNGCMPASCCPNLCGPGKHVCYPPNVRG